MALPAAYGAAAPVVRYSEPIAGPPLATFGAGAAFGTTAHAPVATYSTQTSSQAPALAYGAQTAIQAPRPTYGVPPSAAPVPTYGTVGGACSGAVVVAGAYGVPPSVAPVPTYSGACSGAVVAAAGPARTTMVSSLLVAIPTAAQPVNT